VLARGVVFLPSFKDVIVYEREQSLGDAVCFERKKAEAIL
jgi:hypothetical protein